MVSWVHYKEWDQLVKGGSPLCSDVATSGAVENLPGCIPVQPAVGNVLQQGGWTW